MGRRLVGELLRIHRGRLGLTQKEAGELLLVSESLFGAYERAERIPAIEFLKDADKGLDARGALNACIEMMEEEKYPPKFVDWVRQERLAQIISGYEVMVIRGSSRRRPTRGPCMSRVSPPTPRRRSSGTCRLVWNGKRC